jgi:thiosulfate dehydrogenase [quinone] large subunit
MRAAPFPATRLQQPLLILLRTVIGWHLLYEGYTKLLHPAWSRAGHPLEPFSSAQYLQSAGGPLGPLFGVLARPDWLPWIDAGVAAGLALSGALLILGLLTQVGCWMALALLAAFYLSAIPLGGPPPPRSEGTYLIVNKNLIELIAVATLLSFRTGRMAGLDLIVPWRRRRLERVERAEGR